MEIDMMSDSVWIARLLGPVVVAVSVPMIFSPLRLEGLTRSFLESPALIFISGVLVLVGGLAILNLNNLWVADWRVIITLFGWAMALGGISRIVLPQVVEDVGAKFLGKPIITRVSGVVWLLLGSYLMFKGYGG